MANALRYAVRSSTYQAMDRSALAPIGPFHSSSATALLWLRARSKSFPAQSNSYKVATDRRLYFEWLTDGTRDAYIKARRSGAQRGVPR
jgi:hypothetical protein